MWVLVTSLVPPSEKYAFLDAKPAICPAARGNNRTATAQGLVLMTHPFHQFLLVLMWETIYRSKKTLPVTTLLQNALLPFPEVFNSIDNQKSVNLISPCLIHDRYGLGRFCAALVCLWVYNFCEIVNAMAMSYPSTIPHTHHPFFWLLHPPTPCFHNISWTWEGMDQMIHVWLSIQQARVLNTLTKYESLQ